MDKEAEFAAKLLATFKIEAKEHLKELSDGLLALESGKLTQAQKKEKIETIFREAHSLKGAARAVNQTVIQNVCQILENVLAAWKQEKIVPRDIDFDVLYYALDIIGQAIFQPEKLATSPTDAINDVSQKLTDILEGKKVSVPSKTIQDKPKVEVSTPTETEKTENTIRVAVSKLDKLFQETEELLVAKQILGQWLDSLGEIIRNFNQADEKYTGQKNQNHKEELIKGLEEKVKNLEANALQQRRLVVGMIDSLLEDAKKVLMQPFSSLWEAFPRMVRDISHSLGKEVAIHFQGGDIEIDRRVLEEMKDPLIHLVRNSIDHGIEKPEERKAKNKPTSGNITIKALQVSSNTVELIIQDDGKGIDIEAVRRSAVKSGVISKEDLTRLSDKETLMLIFQSGISTSPTITELSGRGIGLGIVSEKVDRLGGQLVTETKADEGTTFKIILPLTLATFRGIHVNVNDQEYIIPTYNIRHVLQMDESSVRTIENKPVINFENKALPFAYLSDLLKLQTEPNKISNKLQILVLASLGKTAAIAVDKISSEKEVLVKSLGKQLARVKNIGAATILEAGKVVPILNPQDLIRSMLKESLFTFQIEEKLMSKKKTILIVEDAITVRILFKSILEAANYSVVTASDGVEALKILNSEKIDLVLSDVEMPRMDGFKLTTAIRESEQLKHIPIVLCTGRSSPEDRKKGLSLGANAYLEKTTFKQEVLLETINKLISTE